MRLLVNTYVPALPEETMETSVTLVILKHDTAFTDISLVALMVGIITIKLAVQYTSPNILED